MQYLNSDVAYDSQKLRKNSYLQHNILETLIFSFLNIADRSCRSQPSFEPLTSSKLESFCYGNSSNQTQYKTFSNHPHLVKTRHEVFQQPAEVQIHLQVYGLTCTKRSMLDTKRLISGSLISRNPLKLLKERKSQYQWWVESSVDTVSRQEL